MKHRGFTLLEMLVVIAIVGLLAAVILPSLSKGRAKSQGVACAAHLRELGRGWAVYSDENNDFLVPHRIPVVAVDGKPPPSPTAPFYYTEVGNGKKYRPRWPTMVAAALDLKPFNQPDPLNDRQDFDHDAMKCPAELTWVDERNYAYGYNYQFLGNSRDTSGSGVFHNYPVKRHRIKAAGRTVVAGDSMGTAAGFPTSGRSSYSNGANDAINAIGFNDPGNHAYTLDPPRLTPTSDRGDSGQGRTAVDPRHLDKANVVFADGHGESLTDRELGYRKRPSGRYVDLDPDDPSGDSFNPKTGSLRGPPRNKNQSALGFGFFQVSGGVNDPTSNHYFSGTGSDENPPDVP